MKLTIVEKNLLSWTAMHIDFVISKKQVWQLVNAAYKAYEICHFVGLKKEKSHCYSLRFLRKAPTKNLDFKIRRLNTCETAKRR